MATAKCWLGGMVASAKCWLGGTVASAKYWLGGSVASAKRWLGGSVCPRGRLPKRPGRANILVVAGLVLVRQISMVVGVVVGGGGGVVTGDWARSVINGPSSATTSRVRRGHNHYNH